ncbi:MAG: hypothetical protein HQK53_07515, partial [Oligoflexia bacterium]|nr:hypothetical protein [Oligoflexia bacterium]
FLPKDHDPIISKILAGGVFVNTPGQKIAISGRRFAAAVEVKIAGYSVVGMGGQDWQSTCTNVVVKSDKLIFCTVPNINVLGPVDVTVKNVLSGEETTRIMTDEKALVFLPEITDRPYSVYLNSEADAMKSGFYRRANMDATTHPATAGYLQEIILA